MTTFVDLASFKILFIKTGYQEIFFNFKMLGHRGKTFEKSVLNLFEAETALHLASR